MSMRWLTWAFNKCEGLSCILLRILKQGRGKVFSNCQCKKKIGVNSITAGYKIHLPNPTLSTRGFKLLIVDGNRKQ